MGRPLRIAMCEDQAEAREQLILAIKDSLPYASVELQISEFSSGEALLEKFAPGLFDILFMDIYIDGMNGMQVAHTVREVDQNLPIVFITISAEFALESYRVRALHYLIKPVRQEDLIEVWARLLRQRESSGRVILMVDRKPIDIQLAHVMYAEADNKHCSLHTTNGVVVTRLTIDQLQHMLPDPPFSRCHRGYIVNFEHVRSVGEDFQMQGGDTVYIRQNERARIRELYFKYMVDRTKR